MKKILIAALLGVAVLTGCEQTPQEQQEHQADLQKKIGTYQQKFETILHICDANGGVKDYWTGRGSVNVVCTNGLQTNVYL